MVTVPYIAPAGILNGVGQTPSTAVAPGSIISIFGQSLASVAAGWSRESVGANHRRHYRHDQRFDPSAALCIAAADQRAASLEPRGRQLYVTRSRRPDNPKLSGTLTVARNAPGLFFYTVGSTAYAMAFHADGSAGHHQTVPRPAGKPSHSRHRIWSLSDARVRRVLPAQSAPSGRMTRWCCQWRGVNPTSTSTAAPGFTGVVTTQFQVPSGLPSGTSVPVLVTINGVDSNTVMLPIQ